MSFGAAPVTHRLNPALWLGAPTLAVVLATLVFAVPLRVFGLQLPEPVFAMVPAFAWGVIRPSVLAPFLLLLLGLFLDFFWHAPTGLWAVALVMVYGLVLAIRPSLTGRSAITLWIWYGVATAVAFVVGVLITLMKSGAIPGWLPLAWPFLVTVLLYPFAHRLIQRFEDADVRFR